VDSNLLVVFSNAVAGTDDAFNVWYDQQHLPQVLAVPGVVAAQRYDVAELRAPEGEQLPAPLPPPTHRYMVIYQLSDDPETVMGAFLDRVATGALPLGEYLDVATIAVNGWVPRGGVSPAPHES
jgi:hypothetical protein